MNKLALFLVLLASTSALAEEAPQPAPQAAPPASEAPKKHAFLAGTLGPALITSSGGGNHLTLGGRLGFTVGRSNDSIGSVGLAITTLSKNEVISGVKLDSSVTFVAAEYVGRNAWGTGLFFGGRFGVSLNSVTLEDSKTKLIASDTTFAVAPVIGYEVNLNNPDVALVLDGSWVSISGGSMKVGTTTVAYNPMSAIVLHAGVLFNF